MMDTSPARRSLLPLVVLVLLSSTAVSAETDLNFVLGKKLLDADDWPVGDDQGSLGFLSTFGPRSWPVRVAIDVLGSGSGSSSTFYTESGVEIRQDEVIQSTAEIDVGVRKIWRSGRARPFIGGGLGVIWGQQEKSIVLPPVYDIEGVLVSPQRSVVASQDDAAPGVWVDGGVFWRLGKRFNIGLEARYSAAELKLFERNVQAGGFNLGLMLGWGWGGGARPIPPP